MKKKKLKKRIKKLERKFEQRLSDQRDMISNLGDKYVAFNEKYKQYQTQLIKECSEKDGKVDILWEWLQRSGIDFSNWVVAQKIEHDAVDYTKFVNPYKEN